MNENELVLVELRLVGEGDTVFKQVGPVLVKVDAEEAKATVSSRKDLISKQM